ncbi:MAG: hypothetical protein GX889_08455 [Clostridiales bacterium]|nr:hypothetical protein [Clostridiales bacterium]
MYSKLSDVKKKKEELLVLANMIISEEVAKTGAKYFKVKFVGDGEEINTNIFNNSPTFEDISKIKTNSLIELKIKYMGENKAGYDEYDIISIKEIKRKSLINCVDVEKLKKRFKEILSKEIEDRELKKLAYNLFKNEQIKDIIFNAPLNETNGYSFKSGLLAHIVRLCELIISTTNVVNAWDYNLEDSNIRLNKSLLILGAILSDLGSGIAYTVEEDSVKKTLEGRINEPSHYTNRLLFKILGNSEISDEKRLILENVVSSSNYKQGGSINSIKTKEGSVLYNLKKLNSWLGHFEYMGKVAIGDFGKINYNETQRDYFLLDYDEL